MAGWQQHAGSRRCSNAPWGQKNCCGCRRPDEGGCGGGTDRVPGRFPVQLVRDLALHAFVRLANVRIMLKRLVASSSLNALMRARRVAQSAFLRPGWQNLRPKNVPTLRKCKFRSNVVAALGVSHVTCSDFNPSPWQ